MAIESYPDQLEPEDENAVIWRFMKIKKFRDLMATGEIYFCRADRFDDKREGLPPEEYLPILGLNPYDLRDREELLHTLGSDAQFREGFYINCWHLFRDETSKMWKEYGDAGVAVCSQYRLLKSALNSMQDRAFLGLVRYGSKHLTGWNLFRFIYTKRIEYAAEREVRALLWIMDPLAGINRHFDSNDRSHSLPLTPPPEHVLNGHRRKVDLQALMTEIIVSPWASSVLVEEVAQLVRGNGYAIPVRPSELTRYKHLLP